MPNDTHLFQKLKDIKRKIKITTNKKKNNYWKNLGSKENLDSLNLDISDLEQQRGLMKSSLYSPLTPTTPNITTPTEAAFSTIPSPTSPTSPITLTYPSTTKPSQYIHTTNYSNVIRREDQTVTTKSHVKTRNTSSSSPPPPTRMDSASYGGHNLYPHSNTTSTNNELKLSKSHSFTALPINNTGRMNGHYEILSNNNNNIYSAPGSPQLQNYMEGNKSFTFSNNNTSNTLMSSFTNNTTINSSKKVHPSATPKNTNLLIDLSDEPDYDYPTTLSPDPDQDQDHTQRKPTIITTNITTPKIVTTTTTTISPKHSRSIKKIKPLITFDSNPMPSFINSTSTSSTDQLRHSKSYQYSRNRHDEDQQERYIYGNSSLTHSKSIQQQKQKYNISNPITTSTSTEDEDDDTPLGIVQYKCLSSLLKESNNSNISSLQQQSNKKTTKHNYYNKLFSPTNTTISKNYHEDGGMTGSEDEEDHHHYFTTTTTTTNRYLSPVQPPILTTTHTPGVRSAHLNFTTHTNPTTTPTTNPSKIYAY